MVINPKCSNIFELLEQAKLLFGISDPVDPGPSNQTRFYFQRFDEAWNENIDVENLNEIQNKDKIFLLTENVIGEEQEKQKVFTFLDIINIQLLININRTILEVHCPVDQQNSNRNASCLVSLA